MGYPADHKEKTRQKIVKAARRLWKGNGFSGASVDKVMNEAGLTRGGFYAHFKSKDDLLVEVLSENKLLEGLEMLKAKGMDAPDMQRKAALEWYLSTQHRDHPQDGCPLTALTQEIPRLGKRSRRVMSNMIQKFAVWLRGDKQEASGLAALSLMVGAVTLSRAVEDEKLADEILVEAKEHLCHMLEDVEYK